MAVFDLYKRFSNDDDDDAHLSARVGADSRLPPCEFQGRQDGRSWPCEGCLKMVFSSHREGP